MHKPAPGAGNSLLAGIKRFFRRPKGMLVIILAALALLAATGPGLMAVAPGLVVAMVVSVALDAPILRYRKGRWEFPDGALLTGMIVAMLLSPQTPWHVVAVTTVVGVLSKYVLRLRHANIFNPAALALVVTFPFFLPGQDWWGAMPEITPWALLVLIATGVFITDRVNKVPALLTFLGVYHLLFTIVAYAGDPLRFAEIFRAPDLHAALFFAFFMVTDPPTSPPRHREQILFGVIVAVACFAIFQSLGAVYYLPAGLLVGNAWEAWRRWRTHLRHGRKVRHPELSAAS